MRYLILTGASGSGKNTAYQFLADRGYFAVDNLPPEMLERFCESALEQKGDMAVAICDARCGRRVLDLPAVISKLRADGKEVDVFFLVSDDATLVRRFQETRRRHPVMEEGRGSILDAIRYERDLLYSTREIADKVFNTSNLTPLQLRNEIADALDIRSEKWLRITVESFGFKYGASLDADLLFDVRFLKNPYYVPELTHLTGSTPQVKEFLHNDSDAREYVSKLFDFIGYLLPLYQRCEKAYLTIAIGCTGGKHRSVVVAEDLHQRLQELGYQTSLHHRDIMLATPEQEGTL